MLITDVTETMLPLFLIEILPIRKESDELSFGEPEWTVFTEEPFKTIELAEAHRLLMLKEYPDLQPERVRVGTYDKARWRNDLTNAVLCDADATQRALSLFRSMVRPFANDQIAYHWAESQSVDDEINGGYIIRLLNPPK